MVPILGATEVLSCTRTFNSFTTLVPELVIFSNRMLPSARNPTLVLGYSPLSLLPLLSFRTKTSLPPTRRRRSDSSHLSLCPQSCLLVTTRPSLPIKPRRKIPRTFLPKKACSLLLRSLTLSCPRQWRPRRHSLRSQSSPMMSHHQITILEGPSSAHNPSGNDRSHIHLRHPPHTIITKTFIVAYQSRYLLYLIASRLHFLLLGYIVLHFRWKGVP